jgi:hypothetical protein
VREAGAQPHAWRPKLKEATMEPRVGDRITVDSEKAGRPAREGIIQEVLEAPYGTRYRIQWDDGHETVVHPTAGTFRVTSREPASR